MARAIYRESGAEILVEVLSDEDKDGRRRVRVRAVAVQRHSDLCPVDVDDEWTSTSVVGFQHVVGWDLEELEDPDACGSAVQA